MSKPKKKESKSGRILFAVEILVLLLFLGGLYLWGQVNQRLDILEEPAKEFEQERVVINPEAPIMTGYKTYALFGIDRRDKNPMFDTENSDTIMIASVNNDTKEVKIVSIYRDTLLNIGDGVYAKANAAYAYGGPEQAISMLNKNLDLDITDYISINFDALVTAVDCVGGLDVPLSYAEIVHMNNYCIETSEEVGKGYVPVELPEEQPENQEEILGTYHLNGVQATSYCRIRYTASMDMGRTQRQRDTILRIVQKAKKGGLSLVFSMMDEIFPLVKTSLTKAEMLQLMPSMIGYGLDESVGFPMNYMFANTSQNGSVIVPTTLVSNVEELHKFLYGEDTDYVVSDDVYEYGAVALRIVGGEEYLEAERRESEEDENTEEDNYIWYEDDDEEDY